MSSIILESSIGPSDETLSVTFLIDGFDALLSVEKLVKNANAPNKINKEIEIATRIK